MILVKYKINFNTGAYYFLPMVLELNFVKHLDLKQVNIHQNDHY